MSSRRSARSRRSAPGWWHRRPLSRRGPGRRPRLRRKRRQRRRCRRRPRSTITPRSPPQRSAAGPCCRAPPPVPSCRRGRNRRWAPRRKLVHGLAFGAHQWPCRNLLLSQASSWMRHLNLQAQGLVTMVGRVSIRTARRSRCRHSARATIVWSLRSGPAPRSRRPRGTCSAAPALAPFLSSIAAPPARTGVPCVKMVMTTTRTTWLRMTTTTTTRTRRITAEGSAG
mmetsp:Transcript_4366/g.16499  ORF Transcript_4366/g.16499 Transcript_4366/m.16499 type:complete len:226 (-) Transcript_4366:610-1287(-)